LDLLSGRLVENLDSSQGGLTLEGKVFYNSEQMVSAQDAASGIAYVPQQDAFNPYLTVYDTLYYGAALRMPSSK
jgi:ABC-type multidrug transport system ATPase subunit